MKQPYISCICPTYGRPQWLEEAVQCFLDQDYAGESELLILNTCPDQKLSLDKDYPFVRIINLDARPSSLGTARNMAIEHARGSHIIVWDDDDLYLPNHISTIARHFEGKEWVWLQQQFYCEGGQIRRITHGGCNVVAFSRKAWEPIRYPEIGVGEDRHLITAITQRFDGVKVPLKPEEITFLYCWGNGVYHMSGLGDDKPGNQPAHTRIELDFRSRVAARQTPIGDVVLRPKLRDDYSAQAKNFITAKIVAPRALQKIAIVQLGRFGDIINILPIAHHIASVYGKPHMVMSKQFATILDGVSYVEPFFVDLNFDQINEAVEIARREFPHVIRTQVWGKNFQSAQDLAPSYNMEQWRSAGFLQQFDKPYAYPIFDRRDKDRERALLSKFGATGKPLLLVNVTSGYSSPYVHGTELLIQIRERWSNRFEIVDLAAIAAGRIYDLLGLMENAAGMVCIDTVHVHLAACCAIPVVFLRNPKPWLGSVPRCNAIQVLDYNTALEPIHEAIQRINPKDALAPFPVKQIDSPPERKVFHAVERHVEAEAGSLTRKRIAQASWDVLYNERAVIACHLWKYPRSAKNIGDRRELPYLKDVLAFAMEQAAPDDIIFLTNDDNYLHPDLPDMLRFHIALYGAATAHRCEFSDRAIPVGNHKASVYASISTVHVGRDLFAFTKKWLDFHLDKIPDFILGASEWDWCLAAYIRKTHGIESTRENIKYPIHPAELPMGYVSHQDHRPSWISPENVNASASQTHNRKLFADWIAANLKYFPLAQYPGLPPMRRAPSGKPIVTVRRSGALGDVVASLCVADLLIEQGMEVVFQANHHSHCLLRRHGGLLAIEEPKSPADVDLDGAYEHDPQRTAKHFAEMFLARANQHLAARSINLGPALNFAPRLYSNPGGKHEAFENISALGDFPRPWVMLCPRSRNWVNRTVPNQIWQDAAAKIQGTKFWLGDDAAPAGIVDIQCRHVDTLAEYLALADLLVTVDSGPLHIAAALGTPCVAINQSSSPELHLSDQRDFIMLSPPLPCLNCQLPKCPIDEVRPPCQKIHPDDIAAYANARLRQYNTEDVSAIIILYKPDVAKLNRCLAQVLPQVQEVIVVGDLDTPWPLERVNRDSKIKFYRMNARQTGYGRKANYAARHSNGKWLLFLNDDVYLNLDVVPKLRAQMAPDVAIVTHTLRYLDGTIQYAGKYRPPGAIGFGHIDHKARNSRYTAPLEQESLCGASMLVRRKVFFDVNGYDARYYLYSEDDDLALTVRRAGWKIIFTPLAEGIHEEHQSSKLLPTLEPIIKASHALFHQKWKTYFQKNPDVNSMGVFT